MVAYPSSLDQALPGLRHYLWYIKSLFSKYSYPPAPLRLSLGFANVTSLANGMLVDVT